MAGGGTPFRHGPDWGRSQPGPASPVGVQARNPFMVGGTPLPQGEPVGATPVHEVGIVPVQTLYAFYQALPDQSVQQLAQVQELHWPNTTAANDKLSLSTFTVPDKFVYVITDVIYYALCPTALLEGPPAQLDAYQLTGLVHFELTMGDRAPMKIDATVFNPYGDASTVRQNASGWPVLEQVFGARRAGAFALYAKSQQVILVQAVVDALPRFSITKLGAHFHGFSIPEGLFDEIFRRTKGI